MRATVAIPISLFVVAASSLTLSPLPTQHPMGIRAASAEDRAAQLQTLPEPGEEALPVGQAQDQTTGLANSQTDEAVAIWLKQLDRLFLSEDDRATLRTLAASTALEIYQREIKAAREGGGRARYELARAFKACKHVPSVAAFERTRRIQHLNADLIEAIAESQRRCSGLRAANARDVGADDPYTHWLSEANATGHPLAILETELNRYREKESSIETARATGEKMPAPVEAPPASLVHKALGYGWDDPIQRVRALNLALIYFADVVEYEYAKSNNFDPEAGHYKRGALSEAWRYLLCTQMLDCDLGDYLEEVRPFFYQYEIDEAVQKTADMYDAILTRDWAELGLTAP
ncbi:MAG: hypothetical protein AAF662_13270 [Pseudomonadota bacterium]